MKFYSTSKNAPDVDFKIALFEGLAPDGGLYMPTHASGSDIIVVSAPFTIYPLEYSYQGNTKIETIPLWDRFAHGAIPAYWQTNFVAQLASYKEQYTNLYIVLSYDQGYENKIIQYLDNHYKRLYLKDFSTGLEVREYKLRDDTRQNK